MKKLFFTIVVALLSGCTVNPSQVPADYAKEFVSKATYVQDARTGLCYSIVSMRMTMSANQNGISFTWVPCEKAEPFLVK